MILAPDPEVIRAHLEHLFEGARDDYADGLAEIAWSDAAGRLSCARMFALTSEGLDTAAAHAVNINTDGANCYVGVNPRKPGTPDRRANANSVEVTFYNFIDLDDGAAVASVVDQSNHMPATFVVVTGRKPTPRLHAYWRLEEPAQNLPAWERQQAALAAHFDGDPVQDPPRVMRLAGTVSYPSEKKAAKGYVPELVTLQDEEDRDPISAEALAGAYPELAATQAATNSIRERLGVNGFDLEKCLADIAAGRELHNNARDLTAHLVHNGSPDWLITDYLRRVLDDVSDGGTIAEVPQLIASARQKWSVPDPADPLNSAAAWGDPDLTLLDGGVPPPQCPVEVFGPFWAKWISSHAECISVPVDYVAGPVLVAAAAAIGNTRQVSPWEGWLEPCVIWLAKVGTPSSGKSPSDDPIMGLIARLEAELANDFDGVRRQYETDKEAAKIARETWESEVKDAVKAGTPPPLMSERAETPVQPVRPRLKATDATPEALGRLLAAYPRGLLYHRDELSGWLGSFDKYGGSGGERAFWAECFGGRPYVIDRVKDREPIRIPYLSVNILGGIQPDRLNSLLLSGDDDGLPARLLMTWPEPIAPKRPAFAVDNEGAYQALHRLANLEMAMSEDGQSQRRGLMLTDEAAGLFDDFRREHFEGQPPGGGMFASHYGKAPGIVLRIALVLEHLWWAATATPEPPPTVGKKATAAAAALVMDYFLPMARRCYGDAALPDDERGARTILKWLTRERVREFNASHLRHTIRLPGLRTAPEIAAAINLLAETNIVRPNPSREGVTKGRSKSDFIVNSKLWERT